MPASRRNAECPPSAAMANCASSTKPSSNPMRTPVSSCSSCSTRAGQCTRTPAPGSACQSASTSTAFSTIQPSCRSPSASASNTNGSPLAASHTRIPRYGCARAANTCAHTPKRASKAALSGANANTLRSRCSRVHAVGRCASTNATCKPSRASIKALAAPTTPPPTTTASNLPRRLMPPSPCTVRAHHRDSPSRRPPASPASHRWHPRPTSRRCAVDAAKRHHSR